MSDYEVCFNCKHIRYPELRDTFNGECAACCEWAEHQIAALRAEVARLQADQKQGGVDYCKLRDLADERLVELLALKAKLARYEVPMTRKQAFDYFAAQWREDVDKIGVSDADIEALDVIDAAIRKVRQERGKP